MRSKQSERDRSRSRSRSRQKEATRSEPNQSGERRGRRARQTQNRQKEENRLKEENRALKGENCALRCENVELKALCSEDVQLRNQAKEASANDASDSENETQGPWAITAKLAASAGQGSYSKVRYVKIPKKYKVMFKYSVRESA